MPHKGKLSLFSYSRETNVYMYIVHHKPCNHLLNCNPYILTIRFSFSTDNVLLQAEAREAYWPFDSSDNRLQSIDNKGPNHKGIKARYNA